MRASVVIITKNQKHLLKKSIPILLRQNFSGDFEIIVVDSGSTDGAREYIKSQPVKLIEIGPETFNFASAFNIGAKEAKGEFLVRLSGDVIPKRGDFLTEMLKPFADVNVAGTYGKYTLAGRKGYTYPNFWPTKRFPKKLTRYSLRQGLLQMILNPKLMEEITNFAGGCCAIRKSIWGRRPFNERLIAGEDAEYAISLHRIGYDIVYNPKAEVIHEHKVENLKGNFLSELRWRSYFLIEIVRTYWDSNNLALRNR